jgi:hypothetical protein
MAQMFGNNPSQVQEAIRRRATELFLKNGAVAGHDAENCYPAEAEILRESPRDRCQRAGRGL